MAASSKSTEGDAFFEFLTGGLPKKTFENRVLGMREGNLPNPTPYNPADFFMGGDPDKVQHSEVSGEIARQLGAPVSAAVGLGQEASTGFIQFLMQMGDMMKQGVNPAVGFKASPARREQVVGPAGFDIADLTANMQGIQSGTQGLDWMQFLFGR